LTALVAAARRLPTTPGKWRATRDDRLVRDERGLDQAWYLATYPDVAAAGVDPVRHYLQIGWREGRDPRPDFSTRGYLAAHKEVARARQNPFIHYLRHHSGTESPSDASLGKSDEKLAHGERGLDQAWYLATYPDVAAAGLDPVGHALEIGWREGRDPRPDFSTRGYLAADEEVARARQNRFLHYLREDALARGERGVDRDWYLATYPDIAAAGMDPVRHYLEFGWREGRDPRPDFSTRGYLAIHRAVAGSGRNPFIDYLLHGVRKGPPRDVALTSWHWLADSLGGMARTKEWWDYKLVPILSIFYATALAGNVALATMWPALFALVCAVVPCAVYVSFVNDVTDRVDDRHAGKTNRLADKPPWMLALLLTVPLCIAAAFSVAWRDDPPLVAAYLCTWAAFSLYSVPPFRLKSRGILGVVADASGAHLFPALAAALLALRAAEKAIDPVWLGAVAAWAFGCGLRGILWHQFQDLEYDRKAGVRTFMLRHSRRAGVRLAGWVALPLEAIGLAMLLWRMHSLLPLAFLLLYAGYAVLRQKFWAIPVVVAAPRERYSVLGQEYYGFLFPLGILLASAARNPIDVAVVLAHLFAFPGPMIWFAMNTYGLVRDAVHSKR
jgi:4-hydroxybenzoate polyprenyltransferase